MSRESIPDLSRLYRADALEEPPEWLDAKIEAAARDAVAAPSSQEASARRWWYMPLALAAVVLLATSLTLRVQVESDPATEARTRSERGDESAAPEAAESAEAQSRHAAPVDQSAPATAPRAPRPEAARSLDALPRPAAPSEARVGEAEDARATDQALTLSPPPVPAAPPAAPAAAQRSRQFAERLEAAQERSSAANSAEAMKRAESDARYDAKQGPAGASEFRDSAGRARDPQEWLRHISRLMREGRHDEARESLAAFRRQFPDHPVPDELK